LDLRGDVDLAVLVFVDEFNVVEFAVLVKFLVFLAFEENEHAQLRFEFIPVLRVVPEAFVQELLLLEHFLALQVVLVIPVILLDLQLVNSFQNLFLFIRVFRVVIVEECGDLRLQSFELRLFKL